MSNPYFCYSCGIGLNKDGVWCEKCRPDSHITDPHACDFQACNLDIELWRTARRDPEVLKLAETIKEVIDRGLIAKVQCSVLADMEIDITFRANTSEFWLSKDGWWIAMSICMLTRGRMERPKEGVIRFTKSPFDREPTWHHNIIRVPVANKSWTMWMRRDCVETKKEAKVPEKPKPAQGVLFEF